MGLSRDGRVRNVEELWRRKSPAMRTRDVTIPLALWICAAICAHFLFGSGGLVVAKVHDDRSELLRLSRAASNLARQEDQGFEVSLSEPGEEAKDEAPPPPPKPPEDLPKPPPPPVATEKPIEKPKPEEKKEEKRVVVVEKKEDAKPVVLPEDPLKDRRIAVRQHAKPDQADNATAKFIADQANHVDKETRATQTSHDRDDESPTPGGDHPGADQQPGDSEKTRIAESDEHKGEKNRAPGEKGTDFDVVHEPKIPKQGAAPDRPVTAATPPPRAASARLPTTRSRSLHKHRRRSRSPCRAGPRRRLPRSRAPRTATGASIRPGPAVLEARHRSRPQGHRAPACPGASSGRSPASAGARRPGHQHQPDPAQIASVVGSDQLRKEREADGERRKSEHRGSWTASNFERWRSAIENYVSSVKPGNQTALEHRRGPVRVVPEHDAQPHSPDLRGQLPRLARQPPDEPPDERPAPHHAPRDRPDRRRGTS